MYRYQDIKIVHYEITQRCQAACPMCDRNVNGGKDSPHITNAELTLSDAKRIFDVDFIKQLKTFYMCGNLGDPCVSNYAGEGFRYFRHANPKMWLGMNTNGGARLDYFWEDLADLDVVVTFSIDGLEDTNHLYRQNVRWDKVERSYKAFIGAGGRARWDYLIFDHNEHQVEEARQLAKDMGVTEFFAKEALGFSNSKDKDNNIIQSMKVCGRKGEYQYTIMPPTKTVYDMEKEFNKKNIGIVMPQKMLSDSEKVGYISDIKSDLEKSYINNEPTEYGHDEIRQHV